MIKFVFFFGFICATTYAQSYYGPVSKQLEGDFCKTTEEFNWMGVLRLNEQKIVPGICQMAECTSSKELYVRVCPSINLRLSGCTIKPGDLGRNYPDCCDTIDTCPDPNTQETYVTAMGTIDEYRRINPKNSGFY